MALSVPARRRPRRHRLAHLEGRRHHAFGLGRGHRAVAGAARRASCSRSTRGQHGRPGPTPYPAEDRYPFRSVAVLSLAYFCTFGSELAVVSLLPDVLRDTWGLSTAAAGAAASAFAFMNLVTRPARRPALGPRRPAGARCSRAARPAWRSATWPVAARSGLAAGRGHRRGRMGCSVFAQAGNGAVYAIVPLVKKRVSGQIAGMVGAYGNVGGIVFLTTLLFVSVQGVFLVMGAGSRRRRRRRLPLAGRAGQRLHGRAGHRAVRHGRRRRARRRRAGSSPTVWRAVTGPSSPVS